MKLVFTETMGYAKRITDSFPKDEVITSQGGLDEDELIEMARGADVISVSIRTRISEKAIDSLPELKMINTRSAGFDHIAAHHAIEKGIAVTNIPDYGPHTVAEHVFCLMLACARDLIPAERSVREGKKFEFGPFLGTELKGTTLGVIGTGRIGAEVIRRARGFGMRIVAYDSVHNDALASELGFDYIPLDDLLRMSDILTIHVPLIPSTEGLIGQSAIEKMKKGAILINTSRGRIVDEIALKNALISGQIKSVGLDVITDEAHPENDVLIGTPGAVITPHIGFYTERSISKMTDEAIMTVRSFMEGAPMNIIPKEYIQQKPKVTIGKMPT